MKSKCVSYLDLGGTVRARPIDETLKWLKTYFEDLGVTRVANVTGLDCLGVPVAISIRPNAKHLSISQGKGLSWELAMVSAVMESVEGYHAENPPTACLEGSYTSLIKNHPVVDPCLFDAGEFILPDIQRWNFDWISAKNLLTDQDILLPHILTCLDSTVPHPEYAFLSVNSNGLAAGNTLEEAICHGIYEVIERDCLSQWGSLSLPERQATQLNLDSINSAFNHQLIKRFSQNHQLIKIWDITSSIGIPTFHCVIKDNHHLRALGSFRGTGTHMTKAVALSRALTEAAQSRLTLISGSRDDVFWNHYQQHAVVPYAKEDYQGNKNYQDISEPIAGNSFDENIAFLMRCLKNKNFRYLLMVNHTKPQFNIPVVQIFIPGMQFNGARI